MSKTVRTPHIGVIGGTGLYDLEGVRWQSRLAVETPFGSPSEELRFGEWNGVPIVFLARHGARHTLPPSKINYRANIWALRLAGVRRIIAFNAVGSFVKQLGPGTLGLLEQYIDLTKNRSNSFFDTDLTAHITFAEPTCSDMAKHLYKPPLKRNLTCVVIEGPRFNTRAESNLQRSWGADVVNMTAMPEVALAREAQLCYIGVALIADYNADVERNDTTHDILASLRNCRQQAQQIVASALPAIGKTCPVGCQKALEHALATPIDAQSARSRQIAANLGATAQRDGWV